MQYSFINAMHRKKAVTVYFTIKQLLLFGFAQQSITLYDISSIILHYARGLGIELSDHCNGRVGNPNQPQLNPGDKKIRGITQ